jgi:hypothetical protein
MLITLVTRITSVTCIVLVVLIVLDALDAGSQSRRPQVRAARRAPNFHGSGSPRFRIPMCARCRLTVTPIRCDDPAGSFALSATKRVAGDRTAAFLAARRLPFRARVSARSA